MKKIILVVLLALIIVLGSVFNSCESSTYQEISQVVANPTYTKDVEPIIRSTCTGCHGSQFPSLESYAEVKDAIENGDLICRIEGKSCEVMPKSGRMPQTTIDLIKLWAFQGYIN
ncbi:hypothetical protein [Flavobacterium sp.]|uniref:hypothetical protein n=1 Tax=Flavobacterium sp. TaxID=239 RepID=UPI0038FBE6FB